jgi:hypothetical protein
MTNRPTLVVPPQEPTVQLTEIEGFAFLPTYFVGWDHSAYLEGDPNRTVTLYLVGGISHSWTGTAADHAQHWFLTLTGRARVTSV